MTPLFPCLFMLVPSYISAPFLFSHIFKILSLLGLMVRSPAVVSLSSPLHAYLCHTLSIAPHTPVTYISHKSALSLLSARTEAGCIVLLFAMDFHLSSTPPLSRKWI
jgi:predicted Kef-type K+ transport protein